MKPNIVLDKSFKFALDVISFAQPMIENRQFVIGNQLLKSGTSIGANIREAQNAESRQDFIHKMKIAAKEAEETEYWLLLCDQSSIYPDPGQLLADVKEIQKILNTIIGTSKRHLKQNIS